MTAICPPWRGNWNWYWRLTGDAHASPALPTCTDLQRPEFSSRSALVAQGSRSRREPMITAGTSGTGGRLQAPPPPSCSRQDGRVHTRPPRSASRANPDRGVVAGSDPQPLGNAMAGEPLLLTPEEAADVLRIGRTTIYALMKAGELHAVHIGRSCRLSRAELERYVDRLQAPHRLRRPRRAPTAGKAPRPGPALRHSPPPGRPRPDLWTHHSLRRPDP